MIDSHCHLDLEPLGSQVPALLADCAREGITDLVMPGLNPDQWQRLGELSRLDSEVRLHRAVGLHPWWVETTPVDLTTLRELLLASVSSAVAIGECGLDGGIATDMVRQEAYFQVHLEVADECNKPLIVHAHRAHNAILRMLNRHRLPAGGVIHGFSGSTELAQQYWRRGFLLGIGGTITYPRALKTRHAVQAMPSEALLLETDAPDMPLSGQQGRANSPLNLPKVADMLAVLRGESTAEVSGYTSANAASLFSLSR